MAKATIPPKLLSLAQLAMLLNVPYADAQDLLHTGVIEADYTSDRYYFFRPGRLEQLRAAVDGALGTTQYYDKLDRVMRRRAPEKEEQPK